jgi:hypothetical protein
MARRKTRRLADFRIGGGRRIIAEEANWTDKIGSRPLLDKIRLVHFLRQIDKAEGAIRKFEVAASQNLESVKLCDFSAHLFREIERFFFR